MKVFFHEISVSTGKKIEVVDITRQVEDVVVNSGVKDGLCLVHALHSTVAVASNENEYGLLYDIVKKIEEQFPVGVSYQHDRIDDNAHAHLVSTFLGASRTFPVRNSRILRGTWQNVFIIEADGPRSRKIIIEILGE